MTANAALAEMRAEAHVSSSSLSTWLQCPQKWRYRYQLDVTPAFRSGALAFGSAVHSSLAVHFNALKEDSPPPSLDTVFAEHWHQQLNSKIPVLLDDKSTPDSLLQTGQAMLAKYIKEIQLPGHVAEVEMPFSIELADPDTGEILPARLVGALDLVAQREDGSYVICELKTAARRWSESRLTDDSQITAYSYAAPCIGLGSARVDIHLLLKSARKPDVEVYQTTRTTRDHKDFLRMASGVIRAIDAGIFFPRRDWWCPCEFAGPCLAG